MVFSVFFPVCNNLSAGGAQGLGSLDVYREGDGVDGNAIDLFGALQRDQPQRNVFQNLVHIARKGIALAADVQKPVIGDFCSSDQIKILSCVRRLWL